MAYDVTYYIFPSDAGLGFAPWVAIFLSVLALGATIWQSRITRNHNKLTVRPHLSGHSSFTEDCVYKLEVRNDGLGPAIITAARVYRDGVKVVGEGPGLVIDAFAGVSYCQLIGHEFIYPEHVLPAGCSIEVCVVRFDPSILNIDDFLAGHLVLEMDYKSAYGDSLPMYSTRRVSFREVARSDEKGC